MDRGDDVVGVDDMDRADDVVGVDDMDRVDDVDGVDDGDGVDDVNGVDAGAGTDPCAVAKTLLLMRAALTMTPQAMISLRFIPSPPPTTGFCLESFETLKLFSRNSKLVFVFETLKP
jgi:hypothetical protein